jgi:hypothetical protein
VYLKYSSLEEPIVVIELQARNVCSNLGSTRMVYKTQRLSEVEKGELNNKKQETEVCKIFLLSP